MAPAMVLADDETPEVGWLVESDIEYVHAGSPSLRALPVLGTPSGRRSLEGENSRPRDGRERQMLRTRSSGKGGNGRVLYEFELDGGSRGTGHLGSVYAPGLGYATPFDYKNAAERVLYALSVDPHGYGRRGSPTHPLLGAATISCWWFREGGTSAG